MWSKGFNNGAPAVASLALDAADNATDNYLALLSWQAEQYPDSIAAEIVNAPEAYAAPTGKTVYVGTLYTPSNAAWQRFVVLNYTPVVLSGDSEIPGFETGGESVDKPWSASYERSESLDFSYTVNTDKIQLDTLEKWMAQALKLHRSLMASLPTLTAAAGQLHRMGCSPSRPADIRQMTITT